MRLDLVILLDSLLKLIHVDVELPSILGVSLVNDFQDARGFPAGISNCLATFATLRF